MYFFTLLNVFHPPEVCIAHGSNGPEVVSTVQEGLDDWDGGRELGDEQEGVRVLGAWHALAEN